MTQVFRQEAIDLEIKEFLTSTRSILMGLQEILHGKAISCIERLITLWFHEN